MVNILQSIRMEESKILYSDQGLINVFPESISDREGIYKSP